MATITIELPDQLAAELEAVRERLPELLARSLRPEPAPAALYRAILTFLTSNPTGDELARFRPPAEFQERLLTLLARGRGGHLTAAEQAELDEYEHIEHLIVLLKSANLPRLARTA
jgi:hypothetical protein